MCHVCLNGHGGQKVSDCLEQESQTVVSHLIEVLGAGT